MNIINDIVNFIASGTIYSFTIILSVAVAAAWKLFKRPGLD